MPGAARAGARRRCGARSLSPTGTDGPCPGRAVISPRPEQAALPGSWLTPRALFARAAARAATRTHPSPRARRSPRGRCSRAPGEIPSGGRADIAGLRGEPMPFGLCAAGLFGPCAAQLR